MSLQGSFETIALPDLMALLAASNKSGELRVVGGHVEGRLWLDEGRLVGSKVGKAHGHVDALFELLRLTEGNFVFKDGVQAPEPDAAMSIEPLVREAEERLNEWHDIIEVVPSAEHRVRLVPDLATPEITLSAAEWHLVMATALAGTVQGVLEELHLGQFDGFRGLRRLIDAGLVIVEPPRVRPAANRGRRSTDKITVPDLDSGMAAATTLPERAPATAPALAEALAALRRPLASVASGDKTAVDHSGGIDNSITVMPISADWYLEDDDVDGDGDGPGGVVHQFPGNAHRAVLPFAPVDPEPAPSEPQAEPQAEPLRSRVRRPPRPETGSWLADEDVPASPSTEAVDGGYGTPEQSGEPINRGLLLKFLSSVRS